MKENRENRNPSPSDIYTVRKQKKRKRILKRSIFFVLLVTAVLVLYQRRDAWLPKLETIGVRHQSRYQSDPATADGNFPLYVDGAAEYQIGAVGDDLALLTDSYFYLYETGGSQVAARQHTYGSAMLQTAGNCGLLYELSGTRFRLETVRGTRYEKTTADHILFGRLAEDGTVALITASDTCACKLLVFNPKGQQIYQRDCIEQIAELSFLPGAKGCIAASIQADGGAIQSVIHAYSFSQKDELWKSQPLDMLAVSVYNTEGEGIFVLGDTEACYLSSGGSVLSTYVYPDRLVSGACDRSGAAVLLLSNTEKRTHTAVILNGSAKDAVVKPYEKEVKAVGLLPENKNVLVMMRNQLLSLSYDGSVVQETEIPEGCEDFLRIGNYLFFSGFDHIDRMTFRSQ